MRAQEFRNESDPHLGLENLELKRDHIPTWSGRLWQKPNQRMINGRGGEIRTPDLLHPKQAR